MSEQITTSRTFSTKNGRVLSESDEIYHRFANSLRTWETPFLNHIPILPQKDYPKKLLPGKHPRLYRLDVRLRRATGWLMDATESLHDWLDYKLDTWHHATRDWPDRTVTDWDKVPKEDMPPATFYFGSSLLKQRDDQ